MNIRNLKAKATILPETNSRIVDAIFSVFNSAIANEEAVTDETRITDIPNISYYIDEMGENAHDEDHARYVWSLAHAQVAEDFILKALLETPTVDPEQISPSRVLQIRNLLDLAIGSGLELDNYEYNVAVTMIHFGVGAGLDLGIDRRDLESWLPLPPSTFKLEEVEQSEFEGIFSWVCDLVETLENDFFAGADFEIHGETWLLFDDEEDLQETLVEVVKMYVEDEVVGNIICNNPNLPKNFRKYIDVDLMVSDTIEEGDHDHDRGATALYLSTDGDELVAKSSNHAMNHCMGSSNTYTHWLYRKDND